MFLELFKAKLDGVSRLDPVGGILDMELELEDLYSSLQHKSFSESMIAQISLFWSKEAEPGFAWQDEDSQRT